MTAEIWFYGCCVLLAVEVFFFDRSYDDDG